MVQNNCLQVRKYKNDMGSFSYYWAELLSTVEHDRFYLHRRCWLYQMEYQNIWLICIFIVTNTDMSAWQGGKKKYMNDVLSYTQTNRQKRAVAHVYMHKPKGFYPRWCT